MANRVGDVAGIEAAGEEHGAEGLRHDAPAQRPVVDPASATQFLHRARRVPGIEQQPVDQRRHANGLRDGALVPHVDHLDQRDAGQRLAQRGVGARIGRVAELDGVDRRSGAAGRRSRRAPSPT